MNVRSLTWRRAERLGFRQGASVAQFSPWTFALVGGPNMKNGVMDQTSYSDEVIVFDQENYVWEAREEIKEHVLKKQGKKVQK